VSQAVRMMISWQVCVPGSTEMSTTRAHCLLSQHSSVLTGRVVVKNDKEGHFKGSGADSSLGFASEIFGHYRRKGGEG
jgi:hypothetical protein